MNKHQVVWLIVRLVGVYFAYLTITALFGLAGSIPALFTLPKIDVDDRNANTAANTNPVISIQPVPPGGNYNAAEPAGTPDQESLTEKFTGENVKTFVWFIFLTGIYGFAAWYLIRDGRVLYDVLNREEPHGSITEKNPEVTTLNLSDKQS